MKLISYRLEDGSQSVGVLRSDGKGAYDLVRALEMFATAHGECPPLLVDMLDLLEAGLLDAAVLREVEEFIINHSLMDYLTVTDYRTLAPIARPGAIYALGRNYPGHARESGAEVPKEPIVFAKAPTSVIGPEDNVVYKKWLTRVDYEAELAVVIGKEGANIAQRDASSYIAGYTCLNDVTARDLQKADLAAGLPWLRSKGIDTFCPIGPCIVLKDEVDEPIELDVQMRVNGQVKQKDNTRTLTFSVPFLISWISSYHTLHPGDVITTGTPEGVGPVVPGDVMEVEVEKIGVLRNRVVAE